MSYYLWELWLVNCLFLDIVRLRYFYCNLSLSVRVYWFLTILSFLFHLISHCKRFVFISSTVLKSFSDLFFKLGVLLVASPGARFSIF